MEFPSYPAVNVVTCQGHSARIDVLYYFIQGELEQEEQHRQMGKTILD